MNLEDMDVYLEKKEMKVWNRETNKTFKTISYLPPLTDPQLTNKVDMTMVKGQSLYLEFATGKGEHFGPPPIGQPLVIALGTLSKRF